MQAPSEFPNFAAMKLRIRNKLMRAAAISAVCAAAPTAIATERFFTYSYEPETMPKAAWEIEQWVTLRAGRNSTVRQENYNRWEFNTELEYGVTDNYTVSLYVNESYENFRDPVAHKSTHDLAWDGISIENRYMVLNPATKPVGLALYLEPRYNGTDFELEQKIILGQTHGDWKWALNFTHATEWTKHFDEKEGEVEISAGLTRLIGKHWAVGLEARDHNELPDYRIWENSALYLGPVVSYRRENWWATLTVMPQIWGDTFHNENPDGNRSLELEGHERWNARLIVGFSF
jgi:hypothetical protein